MKIALSNGYIYLLDDLFVRKARGIFKEELLIQNTASLLYIFYEKQEDILLEKLILLANGGYTYLYNATELYRLIERLLTNNLILGKESQYGKLLLLIHLSLTQEICFRDYFGMLIRVINALYRKRWDARVDYLIRKILKDIWSFISLYNYSSDFLFEALAFICKDNIKLKYFIDILNNINNI